MSGTKCAAMPSVVKIDPQRKIVQSSFYGQVTGEDLLRHRASIASDSAFSPDYVDLVDFTSVKAPAIDESALRGLAISGQLVSAGCHSRHRRVR